MSAIMLPSSTLGRSFSDPSRMIRMPVSDYSLEVHSGIIGSFLLLCSSMQIVLEGIRSVLPRAGRPGLSLWLRWQARRQLASSGGWAMCIPLARCVAFAASYIPLASFVAVGKLYTASELCGRWQAVWQFGVWVVFGR